MRGALAAGRVSGLFGEDTIDADLGLSSRRMAAETASENGVFCFIFGSMSAASPHQ